jgi:hypothetical protein
MKSTLKSLIWAVRRVFRSRADLLLEVTALRQQLTIYQRQTPRPKLQRGDRLFWIWLCRHWQGWRSALVIVKPETVLGWHREGYRRYWRNRSKGKPGRPRIPRKHIEFIRRISSDHPEWSAERIALILKLKLGADHAPSTVFRYMNKSDSPPASTWRQFIASHADQIFALDLTTQNLWNYSAPTRLATC